MIGCINDYWDNNYSKTKKPNLNFFMGLQSKIWNTITVHFFKFAFFSFRTVSMWLFLWKSKRFVLLLQLVICNWLFFCNGIFLQQFFFLISCIKCMITLKKFGTTRVFLENFCLIMEFSKRKIFLNSTICCTTVPVAFCR